MREEGFRHLQATNAGTTPDSVLRVLAAGMQEIPAYFEKISRVSGATVDRRQADGNYPFPGTKTFGYVSIDNVPGFDAERDLSFRFELCPDCARRGRAPVQGARGQRPLPPAAGDAGNAGASFDHGKWRRDPRCRAPSAMASRSRSRRAAPSCSRAAASRRMRRCNGSSGRKSPC